ncbi:hypothetical protein FEM03_00235 [Phragmitibacter flavus]|uniref:Uncharacterized protein n=1 Tax=Phragmitibacter flavus TaxID=2576071 RepID=A0A5R8KJW5_9BACT|nr:hypothetical protein [Phragmitibacter flavus]TLD72541.1 hypothetical protein FEM03_00235 [Phragmitibacter flavus]
MKQLLIFSISLVLLTGCGEQNAKLLFSGRVEYFYYLNQNDLVSGFTRFEKGLPGTSTMAKEDVYVEVRNDWVIVKLLNRKNASYIVPRDRVRSIIVGTKEGNELNIPK